MGFDHARVCKLNLVVEDFELAVFADGAAFAAEISHVVPVLEDSFRKVSYFR